MFDVKEKPRMVERAILIGVYRDKRMETEARYLLDELGDLVATLEIPVVYEELVRTHDWNAGTLITSGKAKELAELAKEYEADCVIFDNELSPAQQRRWEDMADITTIDRQEIIIDIFASRARTPGGTASGRTGSTRIHPAATQTALDPPRAPGRRRRRRGTRRR